MTTTRDSAINATLPTSPTDRELTMPSSSDPSFHENPGVLVQRQCADLGVSVSEVARVAGVHRSTIFRWKRGVDPYHQSFRRVQLAIESIWRTRASERSA